MKVFSCFILFSAVNRGRTQSLSRRPRDQRSQVSSSSEGESAPDTESSGDESGRGGAETETSSKDDLSLLEYKRQSGKQKKQSRVLTTEMFHRYPFMRLFATGPRNREFNKHKFYCRLCKRNFSLRTKGIGEIKKHFRSRKHFPLDQQYRLRNFLPVYGKDCREVTGGSLEHLRASVSYDGEPPILDAKRPLIDQEVIPTEVLDPDAPEVVRCQMSLYKDFIVRGAPTELLPTLWGNLATVTHHPSMTSNFQWGAARVFVSPFDLPFFELLYIFIIFILFSVSLRRPVSLLYGFRALWDSRFSWGLF